MLVYTYAEDNQLKSGTLGPKQILSDPIIFTAHTTYMFQVIRGGEIKSAR
jgi:hypothetical protein